MDDHGPDCACAECRWAETLRPSFEDFAVGLIVVLLIGLLLAVAATIVRAETRNPPCDPAIPQPPFVVVLPDGTEIPATSWEYDLASRRVTIVGNDRLFCDGFPK